MKKRYITFFALILFTTTLFGGYVSALDGGTYNRAWFSYHSPQGASVFSDGTNETFESDAYEDGFQILTYTSVAPNPIRKNWAPYLADATQEDIGGDASLAVIREEEGNKFLEIETYFVCLYDYYLKGSYIYSVDVKGANGKTGVFTRSSIERLYYAEDNNAVVHYTMEDSDGYIGSTGIAVYPQKDKKVRVVVKSADETNVVKNTMFEFPIDADFDTEYVNIKFANTDELVNIYINDVCICSIAVSELKTYGTSKVQYYSKAVVKDAAGTELAVIDNARIANESELAFCSLESYMCVDNVVVEAYAESKDPGFTQSIAGTKVDNVVVTPSPVPSEATPSPNPTSEPTQTPTQVPTDAPSDTDKDGGNNTVIIIIVAVVAAIAVAVIVLVLVKKKK